MMEGFTKWLTITDSASLSSLVSDLLGTSSLGLDHNQHVVDVAKANSSSEHEKGWVGISIIGLNDHRGEDGGYRCG